MNDLRLLAIPEEINDSDAIALKRAIQAAERDHHRVVELGGDWVATHLTLTAEPPIPKPEALRRGVSWNDESLENVLMGGRDTSLKPGDPTTRRLSADEVKRLARKLNEIDDDRFCALYDEELLEEFELQIVPVEHLVSQFQSLRAFYDRSANDGSSIVIELRQLNS